LIEVDALAERGSLCSQEEKSYYY